MVPFTYVRYYFFVVFVAPKPTFLLLPVCPSLTDHLWVIYSCGLWYYHTKIKQNSRRGLISKKSNCHSWTKSNLYKLVNMPSHRGKLVKLQFWDPKSSVQWLWPDNSNGKALLQNYMLTGIHAFIFHVLAACVSGLLPFQNRFPHIFLFYFDCSVIKNPVLTKTSKNSLRSHCSLKNLQSNASSIASKVNVRDCDRLGLV